MKNRFTEWREGILRSPSEDSSEESLKFSTVQFQTVFFKMRPAIMLNGFSSHQLKLIQLVIYFSVFNLTECQLCSFKVWHENFFGILIASAVCHPSILLPTRYNFSCFSLISVLFDVTFHLFSVFILFKMNLSACFPLPKMFVFYAGCLACIVPYCIWFKDLYVFW